MPEFIKEDFLLQSAPARELYHTYAAALPCVDLHCHLEPERVQRNFAYETITDLWISGDPYKWRAMRINGVEERFITGCAAPEEKFRAFAETLPRMVGSPLFHWSALELKRYFDIDTVLSPECAEAVYESCNRQMADGGFGTADLLKRSNVEIVVTSDGWLADLQPHVSTQGADASFAMRPSLRADEALAVGSAGYRVWLEKVGEHRGTQIESLSALKESLVRIIDAFDAAGCRLSDHSLESVRFTQFTECEAEASFSKVLAGESLSESEIYGLQNHLLAFLVGEYASRKWTLQLHLGAHRETSTTLMRRAKVPGGFACVGDSISSVELSRLLDAWESDGGLPRVIIYPLNIADFDKIASLCGAYVEEGVWGKVQLGPPWWYNDHYEGIVQQLKVFANYSALGRFMGMVTDTRSPLSMARFDYFRRIFCNLIGGWVDDGKLPNDASILEPLVKDVCYRNAASILSPFAMSEAVNG